jgi:hypothetical protein
MWQQMWLGCTGTTRRRCARPSRRPRASRIAPGAARILRIAFLGLGRAVHCDVAQTDRTVSTTILSNTFEAGAVVRAEPFDAVDLDLALVWGPPRDDPGPRPP